MFGKGKTPHRVDPVAVVFPPTYIRSVSKLSLKIITSDPTQFRYEWCGHSLTSKEQQAITRCDIHDPSERSLVGTILLFESENFPGAAAVWPARSQRIVITFSPKLPQWIRETAQLFNQDTGDRIAFVLEGDGLPATGEFYIEHINVGHNCLGDVQNYGIQLQNSGELSFTFSLMERELPFLKFTFSPAGGRLSPGDSRQVAITFEATRVGQFNETFAYQIEGVTSRANSTVTIYGRVVQRNAGESGLRHIVCALY
jgi:hypothetical protein